MAGPIPFWVSGGINGYLQAGLSVDAYAAKYLGIPGSFMGSSNASLWSAAGATAYLSASAGIPNVAEIGFTGNFLLIDIRPSSNSQVKHTGPLTVNGTNYSALVEQRNYVPLWVATMGGSFDVWGKLAGVQHSVRLVSWNPWIFSGDLVWPIVTNEYIL